MPPNPGDSFGIFTSSYIAWMRAREHTPDTMPMASWHVSGSAREPHEQGGESASAVHDGAAAQTPSVKPTYELRRMVGRGGNGEVWEAWQNSLGRIVAVKQLRRDLIAEVQKDDPLALPFLDIQFRQEAYTNAALEHPNILPVYDLGVDGDGRPMLAMKLVHGQPWDRLLRQDRGRLGEEELLAKHLPILISVSQAVAFAHSRGVIHRDLKPAQVMLGDYGEVLLMDWGLAVSYPVQQSSDGPHERTPITAPRAPEAANPAGTVSFMAPEQTDSTGEKIGPWTDLFLLGAILYYLLTETAPHLGESQEEMFTRARAGAIESPEQRTPLRRIPAELSRLCRKAMAPRPEQRFATAEEFIEGLRAYLSGATRRAESEAITGGVRAALDHASGKQHYEDLSAADATLQRAMLLWPGNDQARRTQQRVANLFAREAFLRRDLGLARVQAGRLEDEERRRQWIATISAEEERLQRQEKQRKVAIAATLVVVVALIAMAFYASQERQQRRVLLAENELQQLRVREQERIANAERERSELFRRVNVLRGEEARLADRLTRLLPAPIALFSEDQAGTVPDEGELDVLLRECAALAMQRDALSARVPMEPPPFALELAEAAATVHRAREREDWLVAYELYGHTSSRRPEAPEPLLGMGIAAARAGELTSATLLLERAADLALESQGPNHPQYARAISLLAQSYLSNEQPAEVYETYFRRSLALLEPRWVDMTLVLSDMWNLLGDIEVPAVYSRPMIEVASRVHGETSPELARVIARAAVDRHLAGKYDEAERHLRRAIAIYEENSTQDWSYERSRMLNDLSVVLHTQGRYQEALEILEKALVLRAGLLPEEHPEIASLKNNLAFALEALGETARAEELYRDSLAVRTKLLGVNHPQTATSLNNLGLLLQKQGAHAEAKELLHRALDSRLATYGEDHPEVFATLGNLGTLYDAMGDLESAEVYTRRSLEARRRKLGDNHRETALGWNNVGYLLGRREKYAEALEHYEKALAIRRSVLGDDHPETANSLNNVAVTLFRLDRNDEAARYFEESLRLITNALGADHPEAMTVITNLAGLYLRLKDYDQAEQMVLRVLAHRLERLGPDHPDTISAIANLGAVLHSLGEFELAEAMITMPIMLRRERLGTEHPAVVGLLESILNTQISAAERGRQESATRALATARELFRIYDSRESMTAEELRTDVLWSMEIAGCAVELLESASDDAQRRIARQVAAMAALCGASDDNAARAELLPRWSERIGEDFDGDAFHSITAAAGNVVQARWRALLEDPRRSLDWTAEFPSLAVSYPESQVSLEECRAIIRRLLPARYEARQLSVPEFP